MTLGVFGAGQLGRMLALAGQPLGIRFRFLDPATDPAAGSLGELVTADFTDAAALARFAVGLDVVTYEFENVPAAAVEDIERRGLPLRPAAEALRRAQDRLEEKRFFDELGIPAAAHRKVDDVAELEQAVRELGLPAVLKRRRLGYDGKGQYVLRDRADVVTAWNRLGGAPSLLEAFVPFRRELSVLAVRGTEGDTAFYPLVENHHHDGILLASVAPAPELGPELQLTAETYATRVLDRLDYVGVLAIEFFEVDGTLLANEMAPRVHNSGHWTIEGAETSQFENHLRAVLGWRLGDTLPRGISVMVNLLGAIPPVDQVMVIPGAHLHVYGKAPAPRRKVGHLTLRGEDTVALERAIDAADALIQARGLLCSTLKRFATNGMWNEREDAAARLDHA